MAQIVMTPPTIGADKLTAFHAATATSPYNPLSPRGAVDGSTAGRIPSRTVLQPRWQTDVGTCSTLLRRVRFSRHAIRDAVVDIIDKYVSPGAVIELLQGRITPRQFVLREWTSHLTPPNVVTGIARGTTVESLLESMKPYICTYAGCYPSHGLRKLATMEKWIKHESHKHRYTLSNLHNGRPTWESERIGGPEDRERCPLCTEPMAPILLHDHMKMHFERLAILSLYLDECCEFIVEERRREHGASASGENVGAEALESEESDGESSGRSKIDRWDLWTKIDAF